jgi:acetyl-CoA carboxylase biotin carboxyl carrier protein
MAEHKGHSMNIDAKFVRELAEMLGETGLSEIEVEDGERKIRVARTLVAAAAAPVAIAPLAPAAPAAAVAAPAPAAPAGPDLSSAVKSPMVGTVYLAPEPGADNFASVGSSVKAGDTIMIIEAMKVMNPITAPAGGTLTAVHVENGQPVEFDQPLFTIS